MSHYHSLQNARTEAFYRLPETCPEVRIQIGKAIKGVIDSTDTLRADLTPRDIECLISDLTDDAFSAAVRYGTDKLRSALVDCERDRLDAESLADRMETQRDDLQRDIETMGKQMSHLEDEIASLERQIRD